MSMPQVHPSTEELYNRLPELYRDADPATGFTLLRFLSLVGDQGGAVDDLIARIEAGDLTDADTADTDWLPWLAQLVGVTRLPADEAARRNTIRYAASGRWAGTPQAIIDAARPGLLNPEGGYITVSTHHGGDPWVIGLVVAPGEDNAAVAASVAAVDAKPAGYQLVVVAYSATWEQIEAAYPTWAAIETAGTWSEVETVGLP